MSRCEERDDPETSDKTLHIEEEERQRSWKNGVDGGHLLQVLGAPFSNRLSIDPWIAFKSEYAGAATWMSGSEIRDGDRKEIDDAKLYPGKPGTKARRQFLDSERGGREQKSGDRDHITAHSHRTGQAIDLLAWVLLAFLISVVDIISIFHFE
ncbi:hypothetical protein C8R44DRAFT_750594 [Mycena epipterygia]|nr:hypothetical protein C8R44DRAFT_750594 [Mycena epipterygia]